MHHSKMLIDLILGQQKARFLISCQRNILQVTNLRKVNYNEAYRSISQSSTETLPTITEEEQLSRKAKISKSMKAYLQRSVEHENFMTKKITEYEIGKRHLANMMGENPETFTQDDINDALRYLLPSGLFEPRARPNMNHPHEDYVKKKEAEFDEAGRPFHSLFYTGTPKFYSILQQIAIKAQNLDNLLHKMKNIPTDLKMNAQGSKSMSKEKLQEKLLENIPDKMFEFMNMSLERLIDHPLSAKEEEFILQYREPIKVALYLQDIPELMYTEKGVPYMTAKGKRKKATAEVTVYGHGSGKININGDDITYFKAVQDREQVMFPLQFCGFLSSVDVEASVEGGGGSGQSGAIRFCIATALKSFVSPTMAEKMRIAGLLTRDIRKKERKKPGQMRARRKYTWKKR